MVARHRPGAHLRCAGQSAQTLHAPRDGAARVIMTTYNPISENLIATEPGNGGEANGNCVAARLGGKQPGAKEQSQTYVNSIRCGRLASLRATGEACAKHDDSPSHPPVKAWRSNLRHGWSENVPKEVYVSGESCMGRHWYGLPSHAAVRAFVRAKKSGNADGAKGGRKANASSERNDEQTSALVSSHSSNNPAEEVLREYGKTERLICSMKLLRTLVRGDKVGNSLSVLGTINQADSLYFAERVVFSLRALHREATGLRNGVKRQPESRMREIRTSGSEGGVRF